MDNKIQLRFTLDNLQKIRIAATSDQQVILDWLLKLQENGIEVNSDFYDDLCKSTINNGHNLLRCREIFNIDSNVIEPMAKIIGQHLFRLLFGPQDFKEYLHAARKNNKELEIILEFDYTKEDSKSIMNLPWELMYCPEGLSGEEEEDTKDGFFVSQTASIYRKYKNEEQTKSPDGRETFVSVAFMTRDLENVKDACDRYADMAQRISAQNSNLHFEFPNYKTNDKNTFGLLSKEDVGKIFLSDSNSDSKRPVNKIVHLVCDMAVVEKTDKSGHLNYEKAFYFNKTREETEPIGFTEVFKDLFNKGILQDPNLRLLVLQAWNDEKNYAYTGFEEIANRMIKKNQAAIVSMPYIMNEKSANGNVVFFQTLYQSLAKELSVIETVQQLRNKIFPNYSYGFPLFYLNGANEVLVSKVKLTDATGVVRDAKISEQRLSGLNEQVSTLLEKKNAFQKALTISDSEGKKFELTKGIEEIESEIEKLEDEKKKYSPVSIRTLDPALTNK